MDEQKGIEIIGRSFIWIGENVKSIVGFLLILVAFIKWGYSWVLNMAKFYRRIKSWVDGTLSIRSLHDRVFINESTIWALSHQVQTPMYQCDKDGILIEVNRAWVDLTRLEREDALGEGWTKIIHPEDLEQLQKNGERFVNSGRSADVEFRIITNNVPHEVIQVRATAIKINNAKGEPIRIFGSLIIKP